eukprot:scaffold17375_cov102-Isochrysis_galbana.AAC.4
MRSAPRPQPPAARRPCRAPESPGQPPGPGTGLKGDPAAAGIALGRLPAAALAEHHLAAQRRCRQLQRDFVVRAGQAPADIVVVLQLTQQKTSDGPVQRSQPHLDVARGGRDPPASSAGSFAASRRACINRDRGGKASGPPHQHQRRRARAAVGIKRGLRARFGQDRRSLGHHGQHLQAGHHRRICRRLPSGQVGPGTHRQHSVRWLGPAALGSDGADGATEKLLHRLLGGHVGLDRSGHLLAAAALGRRGAGPPAGIGRSALVDEAESSPAGRIAGLAVGRKLARGAAEQPDGTEKRVLWLLAPLWVDVVAEKHLPRANVAGAGAEAAVGGLGISGQRTHLARGGVPSGQPQRFLCQSCCELKELPGVARAALSFGSDGIVGRGVATCIACAWGIATCIVALAWSMAHGSAAHCGSLNWNESSSAPRTCRGRASRGGTRFAPLISGAREAPLLPGWQPRYFCLWLRKPRLDPLSGCP